MKLQNKICVVTGGDSGIGEAIVERFAREGGRVVVLDVKQDLKPAGYAFVKCDVARPQDVKRAVVSIGKQWKKIDVLVNNAGVYPGDMAIGATPEAVWERVLAVNLSGPFLLFKYALPLLKRSRSPAVVNIASELGIIPEAGSVAYCVSKAGLIMFTKVAALEHAPTMRVNAIAPGPIDTPLLRSAFKTQRELNEYIKKHTLYGRLGKPEEVANAVLFLASDEAAYVTGSVYAVDGGESLHHF